MSLCVKLNDIRHVVGEAVIVNNDIKPAVAASNFGFTFEVFQGKRLKFAEFGRTTPFEAVLIFKSG